MDYHLEFETNAKTQSAMTNRSAFHSHSADTGHIIDFENPEILSTDKIKYRLQIKETLLIHDYSASDSLNINVKSFECKLW